MLHVMLSKYAPSLFAQGESQCCYLHKKYSLPNITEYHIKYICACIRDIPKSHIGKKLITFVLISPAII